MALSPDALEGVRLGKYLVEEKSGEGGMAIVYRGKHIDLDTPVAIKVLFAEHARKELVRTRFRREAKLQFKLRHRNIVRVSEMLEEQGLLGMVMDWVDGPDLEHYMQQLQRPFETREIVEIFFPLLDAMQHAHSQQVVHRDLKPSNILLEPTVRGNYVPRVMDFGIAKSVEDEQVTKTGVFLGTPAFLAPEQIQNAAQVDHRVDIYALGVCLYRAATGKMPFPHTDFVALVAAHLMLEPPALQVVCPEADPRLEFVVQKALEKLPENRYASCADFAEALRDALDLPKNPKLVLERLTIREARPISMDDFHPQEQPINESIQEIEPSDSNNRTIPFAEDSFVFPHSSLPIPPAVASFQYPVEPVSQLPSQETYPPSLPTGHLSFSDINVEEDPLPSLTYREAPPSSSPSSAQPDTLMAAAYYAEQAPQKQGNLIFLVIFLSVFPSIISVGVYFLFLRPSSENRLSDPSQITKKTKNLLPPSSKSLQASPPSHTQTPTEKVGEPLLKREAVAKVPIPQPKAVVSALPKKSEVLSKSDFKKCDQCIYSKFHSFGTTGMSLTIGSPLSVICTLSQVQSLMKKCASSCRKDALLFCSSYQAHLSSLRKKASNFEIKQNLDDCKKFLTQKRNHQKMRSLGYQRVDALKKKSCLSIRPK